MLYVMMLFLSLIRIGGVALLCCTCDGRVCWLHIAAWHDIDSSSLLIEKPLFLPGETAGLKKKTRKGRPYNVFKQT